MALDLNYVDMLCSRVRTALARSMCSASGYLVAPDEQPATQPCLGTELPKTGAQTGPVGVNSYVLFSAPPHYK